MKRYNRLLSLLLSVVMVFSLVACTGDAPPAETTKPAATETTAPPEPSAADIYNTAKAALESATDVTLEIQETVDTTVSDVHYTERTSETLTYRDIGKDTAAILSEQSLTFGENTQDADPVSYTKLYSQGQVYAVLENKYRVKAPLEADKVSEQYTPVVLLDPSLYGSITAETKDGNTLVTFTDATAPEAWAAPEEADCTDIIGTATIDPNGTLTEVTYGITVSFGLSQARMTVSSKPQATPKEITVPTDPDSYTSVEDVSPLYLYGTLQKRLAQSNRMQVDTYTTTSSNAVGWYATDSYSCSTYGEGKDAIAKFTQDFHMMDYLNEEEVEDNYEWRYENGKVTETENESLPYTYSATWDEMTEPMWTSITDVMDLLSPDYWENATLTSFGNLALVEFTFNENFGNTLQNQSCEYLFGDSSTLMKVASKYENKELTGYLSYDICTGLPVAAGYTYEGMHTIQGYDCALKQEARLSVISPAVDAYKNITDELPETQAPEEPATPLFYKVTGADGQQMWLLGTIHVGDAKTAHLPTEIYDAFTASDALAVECDTGAFDEQLEEDEDLANKVAELYMNENNAHLKDILEEEDYKLLVQLLKATGLYSEVLMYYKPAIVAEILDGTFLDLGYWYSGEYGVEERLHMWAEEQNKPVLEVESCLFQMEMSTGWSMELQKLLLQGTMENCPAAYWEGLSELYGLWCSGDEIALRQYLAQDVDLSEMTDEERAEYEAAAPLMEEYDKAMEIDRNEGMLKKAIEYLESGDVVFYAVGLAHLLNETNGLVEALRAAGYTVELVTYGA